MIEDWQLAGEALIRQAGESPPLRAALRARVLRAAARSRRRQALRRRLACAACLLISVIGLAAWKLSTPPAGQQTAHQLPKQGSEATDGAGVARSRNADLFAGPSELMARDQDGQWDFDFVDATIRLRKKQTKVLRGAL